MLIYVERVAENGRLLENIKVDTENVFTFVQTFKSSSSITISFEVKPKLEDVIVKLAPETSFVRVFPFPVDDFEGDVLVGWTSVKPKICEVFIV